MTEPKLHPIDEQYIREHPELARFADLLAKYPPNPEFKASVRGPESHQAFLERQAAQACAVDAARRRAEHKGGTA